MCKRKGVYCPQNESGGTDMELPKNLIQMGKPDRTHKIFVEDYIISYIKEWNRESDGQPVGIALYGQVYKESNYKYYFMYGASRIEGLDRRGPYLSQSDREEINNVGNRYFEEYSFLGWCIVREELPETIFLDTRGKAIEVNGYACFFEKNESMLNFMLEMDEREKRCARQAENAVMDNAWADASPAAQDGQADGQTETTAFQGECGGNYRSLPLENRIAAAKKSSDKNAASEKTASYKEKNRQMIKHLERLKMAAAAMFTVLCVIGITTINDSDKIEEMQVAARQVITDLSQQKIPDAENDNALTANGSAHTAGSGDTALTGGNGTAHTTGIDDGNTAVTATNGPALTGGNTATANGTTTGTNATGTSGTTTGNSADGMPWPDVTPPDAFPTGTTTGTTGTTQTATQPTSYTIMRGDTLNAICRRKYGDLGMVKQVCELNGIKNPNNIEVGQTILLP
jgi:LysM repeat protein/L-rhamnose mutarotase